MRRPKLLTPIALLAAGCATGIVLTDPGARVQDVAPTEVPAGCEMLGDVSIGIPPDAARPRTEEELVTLMRNKAAESGATHVMVESREQRGTATEPAYAGRARAYRCPEGEPEPVAPAPVESEADETEPDPDAVETDPDAVE